MAQGFQKLIPVHDAAELLARRTPAGDDQLVRAERFGIGDDSKALLFPPDFPRGTGGLQLHALRLEGEAQHVHHTVGGVGQGIDPPAVFLHGHKAERVEEVQRRRGWESRESGRGEIPLRPVVILDCRAGIGEVAAPVAGSQQLAPGALLPFKQHHAPPRHLRCRQRGHHAGRPGADDDYSLHIDYLFLLCLKSACR